MSGCLMCAHVAPGGVRIRKNRPYVNPFSFFNVNGFKITH